MLQIDSVYKSYDSLAVLRGVSLTVEAGEIICLLGPSGCGKTTMLRVVAGLERPESGDVRLRGQSVMNQPVHKRDFGLMFQDFALFPHMNVAENVAFGLKMQREAAPDARVHDVLNLVGMRGFELRDVSQLSGGERQRVALARSLAPNPQLLMLDEPLGSLDANLREYLAVELRRIIKETGVAAIYVTHDQMEAFAIADRIAVMNAGMVEQVSAPKQLYLQPETIFVARFLGLDNIITELQFDGSQLVTPVGTYPSHGLKPDAVLIHPLGIQLDDNGEVSGRVVKCTYLGDVYRVVVEVANSVQLEFKIGADRETVPHDGELLQISICEDMVIPLLT